MPDNNAPIDVTALIDNFVAQLAEDSELDAQIAAVLQRLHSQGRLSTDAILGELRSLRQQTEQEQAHAG